jgi:putative DNA primase/helicase
MSAAGDIAIALAGRRAQRLADGSYLVSCPLSSHGKGRGDRNPSLQISAGESQLLVHCHAGCDPRDVLDELRRRGLLDDDDQHRRFDRAWVNARADIRRPRENDDLARIKRAREIWNDARDPRGTLAEAYLRLRHLALDDTLAGHVLRFHPRCPWRNENTGQTEYPPALIAAFRSLDDDKITGIHRIALKPDGYKLGRRMLGVVHRTAIKLDDNVADELAIGEGIETCVAARMLGIAPVWALGSVGGIAHFPVLPGIRMLRIIGENDQASADAIELCGPRWQAAGRRVRVIKPTLDHKDLNDALGAHAYDGTGR